MGVSTTNKQLFIVETSDPRSTMEIQFVPEKVSTNRTARLQNIQIVGRNDDILHYTGGEKTLKLDLEFYAQDDNLEEVESKINWLESLTMNDGYAGAFRSVKIVMGKLFKYQVWVITGVSPERTHLAEGADWLPLRAKVSVSLKLDPDKNRYINDARDGK